MTQANTLPVMSDEGIQGERTGTDGEEVGFGALRVEVDGQGVALPLTGLDVRARIDGLVARTEVRQAYVNCYAEPLEATYLFPLPDRAAVTRFRLEVAGRVVEGQLQERGQARREYAQAIQAGHRAAIAEEERPGVFTLRVGNLPPGERATVTLTLVGTLPFRALERGPGLRSAAGEVTFRFPLVVAPRYIPGQPLPGPSVGSGVEADTDLVPDASRISPPVLLPGFPNPVRLSVSVEVSPSLEPHDFSSSLHTLLEEESCTGHRFRLEPGERLNRDFILRYRLGAGTLKTGLSMQPDPDGQGGTFLLTLVPPAGDSSSSAGRDVIFVLDRSGSMGGWKMVAARRAVARMVETLTPRDRFTIYAFDDVIETPPGADGLSLIPATDGLRYRAAQFLGTLEARGGTEMARPLDQAATELNREAATGREGSRSRVLVLITDGQVGNEDHILRGLSKKVRGVRIFTLGVDRAVNAGFLRRLADLGGGSSELIESEDRLEEVMDHIHRQIGTPVLTSLQLEPRGMTLVPESLVPGRLPDLFAGSPVLISGRYQGDGNGRLGVRANWGQGREVWRDEPAVWREDHLGLASVWARGRVRELEDRYVIGTGDLARLEKEIVTTSLRFNVLSRFTAFVAVDRQAVVNAGGSNHQVTQPVEQPEGWANRTLCAGMEELDEDADFEAEEMPRGFCPPPPASPAPRPAGPPRPVLRSPLLSPPASLEGKARKKTPAMPPAPPPQKAKVSRGRSGGLLGAVSRGVRSLFEGKGKESSPPAGAPQSANPDRTPFRERVEELLTRLPEASSLSAAERWSVLTNLLPDLDALLGDLRSAGDSAEPVQKLDEVVNWLRSQTGEPSEVSVSSAWDKLREALQQWLLLASPGPGRQEQFWK